MFFKGQSWLIFIEKSTQRESNDESVVIYSLSSLKRMGHIKNKVSGDESNMIYMLSHCDCLHITDLGDFESMALETHIASSNCRIVDFQLMLGYPLITRVIGTELEVNLSAFGYVLNCFSCIFVFWRQRFVILSCLSTSHACSKFLSLINMQCNE